MKCMSPLARARFESVWFRELAFRHQSNLRVAYRANDLLILALAANQSYRSLRINLEIIGRILEGKWQSCAAGYGISSVAHSSLVNY